MQGWECPKCGRCYSPDVGQCAACPVTVSSGGNTEAPPPWRLIPAPLPDDARGAQEELRREAKGT